MENYDNFFLEGMAPDERGLFLFWINMNGVKSLPKRRDFGCRSDWRRAVLARQKEANLNVMFRVRKFLEGMSLEPVGGFEVLRDVTFCFAVWATAQQVRVLRECGLFKSAFAGRLKLRRNNEINI